MKNLLFVFILLEGILIFSVFSLFGIKYTGIESGPIYIRIVAISAALSVFCAVFESSFRIVRTAKEFFCIVLLCMIAIVGYFGGYSGLTVYKCFLAFAIPSSIVAIVVSRRSEIVSFLRWFDVASAIITVALLFSIPELLRGISQGDVYYSQSLSYHAALAFSINLFLPSFIDHQNRFRFFRSAFYRHFVSYLFYIVQLFSVFASGGRGGFVVIVISVVLYLYAFHKDFVSVFRNYLPIVFAAIALALFVLPQLSNEYRAIFHESFSRVFSYITESGIDMSQTSGRDNLYSQSISLILDRPILGYGFLGYTRVIFPYPHNLFLELSLQGGIPFCLLCTVLLILVFAKVKRLVSYEKENGFLIPIIAFQFTQLMLTGSYIQSGLFWFVVFYTLNRYCPHNKKGNVV